MWDNGYDSTSFTTKLSESYAANGQNERATRGSAENGRRGLVDFPMSIIDEQIAQLSARYVEAVEERIILLKHAVSSEYMRCLEDQDET